MMEGCSLRASENNPATSLFDSPNHLSVSDETLTLMKVAPDSLARDCEQVAKFSYTTPGLHASITPTFASIVLPQPGGP